MGYTIRTEAPEEPIAVRVSTWYDRHTRSYVSQLVDAAGRPVGDASYDGTKADRDASVRSLSRELPLAELPKRSPIVVEVRFSVVVDRDAYDAEYGFVHPVEEIREYVKSAAKSAAASELEGRGFAVVR